MLHRFGNWLIYGLNPGLLDSKAFVLIHYSNRNFFLVPPKSFSSSDFCYSFTTLVNGLAFFLPLQPSKPSPYAELHLSVNYISVGLFHVHVSRPNFSILQEASPQSCLHCAHSRTLISPSQARAVISVPGTTSFSYLCQNFSFSHHSYLIQIFLALPPVSL